MFTLTLTHRDGSTESHVFADYDQALEHGALHCYLIASTYSSGRTPVTLSGWENGLYTANAKGTYGILAMAWIGLEGRCSGLLVDAADESGAAFQRKPYAERFGLDAVLTLIESGDLEADPLSVWMRDFPPLLRVVTDSDREGPGGYVTDPA